MKYCKGCKIPAKETDTVCARCGKPVSTFGAAQPASRPGKPADEVAAKPPPMRTPTSPAGGMPRPAQTSSPGGMPKPPPMGSPRPAIATATATAMFTLSGKLGELEDLQRKNVIKGRGLGLLSLLAILAILFVLYEVYSRTVLAYAVLENIKVEQDPLAESQITVSFDVKSPGKVAFDRRSGSGHTEKVDVIGTAEHHKTVWSWPSDPKTGIDFSVVFRDGWFRTSQDRHFDVTRAAVGVEVVFLMDVTSSMQPYIDGLKEKCIAFADHIRKEGVDCQLGLIGFGDVEINEPITVFDPTSDVKKFQSLVARLELTDGGDSPESSLEAIERALEMRFRPHTRVCFVHITDAGCHHREKIRGLAAELTEKSIVTFVISQRALRNVYGPLCVNGGVFFGIRDAPFETILKEVAKSITSQIKSD